jgi:hypothetical protein
MAEPSKPWDAVLKEVLVLLCGQAGASVITEYEVSRLPRKIDGVTVLDEAARAWFAENTPLDFLAIHVIMEGKSEKARLNPDEYKYIVGRTFFYLGQAHVDDLEQVTVCVITAGPPWKVLKHSRKLVKFEQLRPWLWRAQTALPFYVLVASRLEVEPKNYPFLLFATGKKRKEFLRALVQEAGSVYLSLAFELYPREVTEELMMSRQKKKEWTKEEAMQYLIDQMGTEQILRLVRAKEEAMQYLLDQMGPDLTAKVLRTQSPDAQSRLIEALIEQLGPEKFEAHLQERREAA